MISFACGGCKAAERPRRPWVYLACGSERCSGFGTTLRVADAVRATYGTIGPMTRVTLEIESCSDGDGRRVYSLRPVGWPYPVVLHVPERDEDRELQAFVDSNPNAFPCPECKKTMAVFSTPGMGTNIFHERPECPGFSQRDPDYRKRVLDADRARRAETRDV